MSTPISIIGFSGNRPSDAPGRSRAELEAMREPIHRTLDACATRLGSSGGRIELRCSAAEGADTIACEVAIARGIALHVILPKPIDAFREDFADSPPGAWERALKIIDHAQQCRDGSTLRVVSPSLPSPTCYQQVNEAILEGSDAIIILWNGAFTDSAGGTGEVLQLSRARGLPHAVLDTLDPTRVRWIPSGK